ncbi:RsmE family RNA methyltransferase [Acidicapsa dinghuensis]|uniref:Ribosomal RNA small subunit methyltransferase E n=1 Tax=Acidicapsa dinghuensis TaxID=2218256 RepID=A0ABW1EML2_9BACT|nr:RsmE family RNA methyltransferase [Acidicapsa dinghuensis]
MTRRRWIADSFTNTTATLTGVNAEHLAHVLRAQPGMEADVLAGGYLFHAVITSVSRDEVVFELKHELEADAALPITLLLSIFKFDRMEWAIEKATELGVARITPINARRTEKHLVQAAAKRVERWRRIAQEAAQQSRRSDLPVIDDPTPLAGSLVSLPPAHRILLAENEQNISLRTRIEKAQGLPSETPSAFQLAIGPEGGWTNEELALFEKHNWQSASLGSTILRAETAAIAAISITAALISDL